jgi:hypothetical protein
MLPAYGRELLELRRDGRRPAQPVFATVDWEIAKSIKSQDRFVLVMTAGDAPLDCSMLAELDIVVINVLQWPDDVCRRALNAIRAARPRRIEYRHWDWARDDPARRAKAARELNELIVRAQRALERSA